MKLIEAWVLSEELLERYGKRPLNEKRYYQDGKPQRRISFDKIMETQPPEISVGEATYPVLEYAQREFPVTTPLEPRVVKKDEGVNHYKDFDNVIRKRLIITVPNFFDVHVDPDYLKAHIEAKMRQIGGKLGKDEDNKRKTSVPYFWMTLEDPQEIWVNNDDKDNSNELSYVFFKQFRVQLESGKIVNLAMIVVVGENYSVKTYYFETGKNISKIYKRRWGAKIFSK